MFIKIEGPEQLMFPDQSRVRSRDEYLGWHSFQVQQREIADVTVNRVELAARINHGRWLADCPVCEVGALTRPDWGVACCISCGTIYPNIKFPDDVEVITRLLLAREKRITQSWIPTETAEDLFLENMEHEVFL